MNLGLIIFIGIVQGILFIAHFVVYKALLFFGNIDPKSYNLVRISFFALSIFFMIGSIITAQGYSIVGRVLYTLAAVWLGVLFWLFSMAIIGSIIWFILSHISPALSINTHAKQSFGLILLTIVLAINIYAVINAQFIRVKKYNVSIPNLPEAWINKKAVFFADTHYGNIWNKQTAERLVEKIEKLDPSIIFISGDFYDGPKINFQDIAETYRPLVKTAHNGIYFVAGNHEEYQDTNMYLNPMREVGINILESNSVLVDGLRIAGVGYGASANKELQDKAIGQIHAQINMEANQKYADEVDTVKAEIESKKISDAPIIFLKHVPLLLDSADKAGFALQLSGHTHRGQMWPFSLITKKIYKGFDYGLKRYSDSFQVITTSGAGSWGPPQRFGTQSEIVEITFTRP